MNHLLRHGRRALAVIALALPVVAASADGEPAPAATRKVEVRRQKLDRPDEPSLVFLKDNRVFLRAQLDLLRQRVKVTRDDSGQMLDARLLRLREMAAAIAAARDTVGDAAAATATRTRLSTVAEVGRLEDQLNLMDSLLEAQKQRLAWLEADYLGQQHTALVVVVGGFAGRAAPDTLVLSEGGETWRVGFTSEQKLALEQGGVAQVHHAFVEPRTHEFSLSCEGAAWQGVAPAVVMVEAPRDRLTFLELDLAGLGTGRDAAGLSASVWQR